MASYYLLQTLKSMPTTINYRQCTSMYVSIFGGANGYMRGRNWWTVSSQHQHSGRVELGWGAEPFGCLHKSLACILVSTNFQLAIVSWPVYSSKGSIPNHMLFWWNLNHQHGYWCYTLYRLDVESIRSTGFRSEGTTKGLRVSKSRRSHWMRLLTYLRFSKSNYACTSVFNKD